MSSDIDDDMEASVAAASSSSSATPQAQHTRKRKTASTAAPTPASVSSSRQRRGGRVIDYSRMNDDEENEPGANEEDEGEREEQPKKKRKSGKATTSKNSNESASAASSSTTKARRRRSSNESEDEEEADTEERKTPASRKRKGRSEAQLEESEAYFASTSSIDDAAAMSSDEVRQFRHDPFEDKHSSSNLLHPAYIPDPTKVAPAGILTRMLLRNIMNFKKFQIEFNPNLNFIYGKNGAGKSSILHAIQLVFGAKAADTNRGRNLSEIIQHGKDYAEITVWIKNHAGASAYKHDLYGDEIELKRTFSRTHTKSGGSSAVTSFTMSGKDKNGKAYKTTNTKDVREMYEYFNIQVSNPCVVMTQEVSKKFLQSKREEDKYMFFLKATQLENLRENLYDARGHLDDMEAALQVHKDKLPEIEAQIADLNKKEKLAQEANELENDIRTLKNKMLWRAVKDAEIKYDEMDAKRESINKRLTKEQEKLAALEASHQTREEFDRELEQHKGTLNTHNEAHASLTKQIESKQADIVKIKHEQRHLLARVQQGKQRIKELQSQRDQANEVIRKIAERNSRDTSDVTTKLEEKQKTLQEEKAKLEVEANEKLSTINSHNLEQQKLRNDDSELQEALKLEQGKMRKYENEVMQIERHEASAAAAASSSSSSSSTRHNLMFGAMTGAIWHEIRRQSSKFLVEPIGPLGEHVTIASEDERWLPGITECLTKKNMSTYVVDSFEDQRALQNIINTLWKEQRIDTSQWKPQILILKKSARYHVRKPNVPFKLVMDTIKIENDWAFNSIVFLCKIERYGLHADSATAVAQLRPFRSTNMADPTSNEYALGSFLSDGTKVRFMGSSAAGSIVSQSASEKPMFRVSQAEALNEARTKLADHKHIFDDMRRRCQEKGDKIRAFRMKTDPLIRRNKEIEQRISKINEECDTIEYEIERARRQMQRQDDTEYVTKVNRLTNEIAELEAQLAESGDSSHFTARIEELKVECEEIGAKQVIVEKQIEDENNWLKAAVSRWAKHEVSMKRCDQAIKLLHQELATCETEFGRVSMILQSAEMDATNECPDRIDSDDTKEVLSAKHQAKLATLAEKRRRQPINLEDVRDQLKAAHLAKLATENAMSSSIANHAQLKAMGTSRQKKMMACRKSMANSASYAFNALLKPQGATGQLMFDHKEQKLAMVVNPNTRDTERQDAASTVVLSGGERSVTTIAFVMAVGEQVECPFRAIDEFDVFMDSVNRRTSMELLLSIAKRRKDRQFFFLSPQDITGLTPSAYFKIIKLRDPERELDHNQTVLDYSVEEQKEE